MRTPVLLFVTATALCGASQAAHAQAAAAYSWCGFYPGEMGGQSCYYRSKQECMATMSGIGGTCTESPYARSQAGAAPIPPRRRSAASRRRGGNS